jgi:hypothetical protein
MGCTALTSFKSDLSSITSLTTTQFSYMFYGCKALKVWDASLSSLTSVSGLFSSVHPNIVTFKSNLSSVLTGTSAFSGLSKLTHFDADLSSMTIDCGNY